MAKINQEQRQHDKLIAQADKLIKVYTKFLVQLIDYREAVVESQRLGTTPPKPPKNPPGV